MEDSTLDQSLQYVDELECWKVSLTNRNMENPFINKFVNLFLYNDKNSL